MVAMRDNYVQIAFFLPGINVLMHIMSKLAKDCETPSEIHHYERLEFLGDSVIEFLSRLYQKIVLLYKYSDKTCVKTQDF